MRYSTIEEFLTNIMGLDPESLGARAVERAIGSRMKIVAADREADYLALLQTGAGELEALIETVVVPETWFFRDLEPYNFLREYVLREWNGRGAGRTFRVLSVPCSTGEEPFSIVITLLEAGLDDSEFRVDAVDISARALEVAKRGFFGKGSFRERDVDYQRRYFTPEGRGFRLHEEVRRLVHFQRGNILDPGFCAGRIGYDVIFCRNLLIYMTPAAKRRTLDKLDGLLVEGGLLFAGHAEMMLVRSYGYASVGRTRVFACRKAPKEDREAVSQPEPPRPRPKPRLAPRLPARAAPGPPGPVSLPARKQSDLAPPAPQRDPGRLLEMARDLGNRGALEEARALCEQFLQEHRLDSEAHYLMGLLQQASARNDLAEECFHRALYLNPNHHPVLVQLYLLYEQRGDRAKAAAFRERAARVEAQQHKRELQDRS